MPHSSKKDKRKPSVTSQKHENRRAKAERWLYYADQRVVKNMKKKAKARRAKLRQELENDRARDARREYHIEKPLYKRWRK